MTWGISEIRCSCSVCCLLQKLATCLFILAVFYPILFHCTTLFYVCMYMSLYLPGRLPFNLLRTEKSSWFDMPLLILSPGKVKESCFCASLAFLLTSDCRIVCLHTACCIAVCLPVCLPCWPVKQGLGILIFHCVMSTGPRCQWMFVTSPKG